MADEVAEEPDTLAEIASSHLSAMKTLANEDRSLMQDTSDLLMGSIRKGSAVRTQVLDAALERLGIKPTETEEPKTE